MEKYTKITLLSSAFNQTSLIRHLRAYLPDHCHETIKGANALLADFLQQKSLEGLNPQNRFANAKAAISAMLEGHTTHAREILGTPTLPPTLYIAAMAQSLGYDFSDLIYNFQNTPLIKNAGLLMSELPILETLLSYDIDNLKTASTNPEEQAPNVPHEAKLLFMLEQRRILSQISTPPSQAHPLKNQALKINDSTLTMAKIATKYIWPQGALAKQNWVKSHSILLLSRRAPAPNAADNPTAASHTP